MATQTIDKELEIQMREDCERFFGILAHYKPGVESTIDDDFQAALQRDEIDLDADDPFHSYIFSEITQCIIKDCINKYGDKCESMFGLSKTDFEDCLFDSISWYLDGLTIDFYIDSERIFTLDDIEASVSRLISGWRIDEKQSILR